MIQIIIIILLLIVLINVLNVITYKDNKYVHTTEEVKTATDSQ